MRELGTPATPRALRQGIGLLDATALVIGSMIGSGIFIVSAESARTVGATGWLLLAWVAAGAMTLVAALCCAELAAMLPKAGGEYVFLRQAYGPLTGFLFGWTLFLVIQSGTIAAVAVAFAKFLGVLLPSLSGAALVKLGRFEISAFQGVAIAVVLALTASNATGLKAGTLTQRVFTGAKLAALLGLTGFALWGASGNGALGAAGFWHAAAPTGQPLQNLALVGALGVAMVGPLFSQSAWNNVTFAGEEVQRPGLSMPRALVLGCAAVTVLYVLANLGYARVLTLPQIQHAPEDRVAAAVATALWGSGGAQLMAGAIMVSTFGCLNGLILSGARVSFAMARDGLFFSRLQRLNAGAVPAAALWAQALWCCVLILSGTYAELLKYVISVDLLFYVLLVGAVLVLRRRQPELARPFRAPAAPVLVGGYALVALSLIAILLWGSARTAGVGYVLMLSGIPAYFIWNRRMR